MVERPHSGPLPPAHPVAHGRPPTPDGQTVPQPVAPPVTRRQYAAGWICAALILGLVVAGILGRLS